MKRLRGPLKTDGSGFRWLTPHAELFNRIWHDGVLSPAGLPGASAQEAAAYASGLRAIGRLGCGADGKPVLYTTTLSPRDATRVVALLVELARRHPDVLAYPGRLHEACWPVLSEAYRQHVLRGPEDLAQLRRVVSRAAAAVSAALRGPAQQWWVPFDGQWLWASTTRSLTTGRVTRLEGRTPELGRR